MWLRLETPKYFSKADRCFDSLSFWAVLQIYDRQFNSSNSRLMNLYTHPYLTACVIFISPLLSYIIVSCGALERKTHLFLSFILKRVQAARQQPWTAVHPSDSVSPVSSRGLFSALSKRRHWCVQCASPALHHFISYPEQVCFEGALSSWCVCVCFLVLWGGFKKLLLLLFFLSSRLLWTSYSTLSDRPDMPLWKTVFLTVLWYPKNKGFYSCCGTVWKDKFS